MYMNNRQFFRLVIFFSISLFNHSQSIIFAGAGSSTAKSGTKPQSHSCHTSTKPNHETSSNSVSPKIIIISPAQNQANFEPKTFDFEAEISHSTNIEIKCKSGKNFNVPECILRMSFYFLNADDEITNINNIFNDLNENVTESLLQAMTYMYIAFKNYNRQEDITAFFITNFNQYMHLKIVSELQLQKAKTWLFVTELLMAMNILKIGITLNGIPQNCILSDSFNILIENCDPIDTFGLFISPEFRELYNSLTKQDLLMAQELIETFTQQISPLFLEIAKCVFVFETAKDEFHIALSSIFTLAQKTCKNADLNFTNLRLFINFLTQYNIVSLSYDGNFESQEILKSFLPMFKNTLKRINLRDNRFIENWDCIFFRQFNHLAKITCGNRICRVENQQLVDISF